MGSTSHRAVLPIQDRKQPAPSKSLSNELSESFEVQLRLFANLERWSPVVEMEHEIQEETWTKTGKIRAKRVFLMSAFQSFQRRKKLFVVATRLQENIFSRAATRTKQLHTTTVSLCLGESRASSTTEPQQRNACNLYIEKFGTC